MKKVFPFASILILLIAGLSSCKYEEGPIISLRSKAERLANTWIISSAVDQDGNDNTDAWSTSEFTFEKEGGFTGTYDIPFVGTVTYNGSWVFVSDNMQVQINSTGNIGILTYNFNETLDILRLTEKEIWLQETDGDMELLKWVPKN